MNRLRRVFYKLTGRYPAVLAAPDHPTAGETVYKHKGDGRYIRVCAVCHGNCGQCGTSLAMGEPFSFDAVVDNLNRIPKR